MKEQEIRRSFLDFFVSNQHLLISGSPLVPENDPTLLLINSGMAPLKKYFTGETLPPHPRLTNSQRCIRTNDIEEVGDKHHLTFFEMLGSWSIGDYYKRKAIGLASELLMGKFGIPQNKLYVSVYKGNSERGLSYDEESHESWEKEGFFSNQIVPLGDEDNFWGPAGLEGPCGPCTEVFLDMGEETGPSYEETGIFDTKNRYIEIWNAGVFMEFYQHEDGKRTELPFKSVDTGAGIERFSMALNGYKDVYEYGPYPRILSCLPNHTHIKDRRVIADHIRAASHLISEGVFPNKGGKEYISRRLLRRAEVLCFKNGFSLPYADIVHEVLSFDGQNNPSLKNKEKEILSIMKAETQAFSRVLRLGARHIEKELKTTSILSSQKVFDIVSSIGMPLDIIKELVSANGGSLELSEYEALLNKHKTRSKIKVSSLKK